MLIAISYLSAEFIRNDNLDVVLDTSSDLMYEDTINTANSKGYIFQEAIDYCDNLNLAGVSDWYLPNRNVLSSIMTAYYGEYDDNWEDWNITNGYMKNNDFFIVEEFENIGSFSHFWTSESYSNDKAWDIGFRNGNSYLSNKSDNKYVRCARVSKGSFDNSTFSSLSSLKDDFIEVYISTTPPLKKGWNLVGNASNTSQTIYKNNIDVTWTFDYNAWTQNGNVLSGQGFWAKSSYDIDGLKFSNDGDGTGGLYLDYNGWFLISGTRLETLADTVSRYDYASYAYTYIDDVWYTSFNDGDIIIEEGRGVWVRVGGSVPFKEPTYSY